MGESARLVLDDAIQPRFLIHHGPVDRGMCDANQLGDLSGSWSHFPSKIVQCVLYYHHMLTIASRLDVMNRLGRAMADPTRSRILMTLLGGPSYPAVLSRELVLTRSNVSNHLTCLRDCGIVVAEPEGRQTRYEIADPHLAAALIVLVDVTLAVDENAPCVDVSCTVPGCCLTEAGA